MTSESYMTVGELARRVGVTVRTIQYYDQKGLLSPTEKGPNNQRLYSARAEQDLARILTYKYLGLSLVQIKEAMAADCTPEHFQELVNGKLDDIQNDFQQLFKRMATLREMLKSSDDADPIDWIAMTSTIDGCQDDSDFYWRIAGVNENGLPANVPDDGPKRMQEVGKWHDLIAETIRAMSTGEPVDGPVGQDIARRYLELDESQNTLANDETFILMENIAPHIGQEGSFGRLRESVCAYLDDAARICKQNS